MQPGPKHFSPDLHVHTDASDGQFSPLQVIGLAKEKGVNLLAITDHDTLDGLSKIMEQASDINMDILPGVEISAGGDNEVHILGYGINEGMKRLHALLQDMRREREERVRRMIEKLRTLGMPIDLSEIASPQADSLGRAHIGRAMVRKGLADSIYDAFVKYLSPGRPGFEPRPKRKVSQVVRLLREEGAVPVIAHPGLLKMEPEDLRPLLYEWKEEGLMGLEAYHPAHLPAMTRTWDSLARKCGLLVTGGSDFHGQDGRHLDIGAMLPHWPAANEDVHKLLEVFGPSLTLYG
jgi:predicted metal-dependent phosphoesterase TrpH